jgi:hypothetical protein
VHERAGAPPSFHALAPPPRPTSRTSRGVRQSACARSSRVRPFARPRRRRAGSARRQGAAARALLRRGCARRGASSARRRALHRPPHASDGRARPPGVRAPRRRHGGLRKRSRREQTSPPGSGSHAGRGRSTPR